MGECALSVPFDTTGLDNPGDHERFERGSPPVGVGDWSGMGRFAGGRYEWAEVWSRSEAEGCAVGSDGEGDGETAGGEDVEACPRGCCWGLWFPSIAALLIYFSASHGEVSRSCTVL
jgi:hypothetical protein